MIDLIESQHDKIVELCRRYGVTRLDLFGSAAAGDFDPARSDVDFLLTFEPPDEMSWAEAYFGLKEDLEALLGRPVDLVDPDGLRNPYLIESIEQSRTPLYAA